MKQQQIQKQHTITKHRTPEQMNNQAIVQQRSQDHRNLSYNAGRRGNQGILSKSGQGPNLQSSGGYV